jgi:hypothetical protein
VADLAGDGRGQQLALGDGRRLMAIGRDATVRAKIDLPRARVLAANDLNGDGRVELVIGQSPEPVAEGGEEAKQSAELIVLQGTFEELARYRVAGAICEAIISDLGCDGVNEILVRVGQYRHESLEIVGFQPLDQPVTAIRTHPANVVKAYLAALREPDAGGADEFVLPTRREAVRKSAAAVRSRPLPGSPKLHVSTHVDDATAEVEGWPQVLLRLQFAESKWWIAEIQLDEPAARP